MTDDDPTDLRALHDAFDALEQRADAAPVSAFTPDTATRPGRRWGVRVLAPIGAGAVVAAAAVTVAMWPHSSSGSPNGAPAGRDGGSSVPTVTASVPTAPSSPALSSTSSATRHGDHYLPPQSGKALAAKARVILDGIATIKIDPEALADAPANPPPPTPVCPGSTRCVVQPLPSGTTGLPPAVPAPPERSGDVPSTPAVVAPEQSSPDDGAAIWGTLTSADGHSGGFLLNVYTTTPPLKADCSGDVSVCKITRRDGVSVAVGHYGDPSVTGSVTYEVTAVRPDGADIAMVLSTEADPKGQSKLTSSTLPLTVKQLVALVTSDQW